MDKVLVFETLLNKFETEEMKDYCTDMIKEIPDYIFTIPSSTSFKYHNKTQCQPHGQILHIPNQEYNSLLLQTLTYVKSDHEVGTGFYCDI